MKPMSLGGKLILAFVLPLGLAYYLLVLPQVRATASLLGELDARQDRNQQIKSGKQKEAYQQQAADLRTKTLALLPATDEQYDLSVQVEALAKAHDLAIGSLTINAAVPTDLQKTTTPTDTGDGSSAPAQSLTSSLLKVTVTTAVTGSYENVQEFIGGITALGRFMQIDQAIVSVTADKTVNLQVTAFAYYLPKK